MPPENELAILSRIKNRYISCFMCKEPVGRIQEKKGKAFCYRCQQDIFGPKPRITKEHWKPRKRDNRDIIKRVEKSSVNIGEPSAHQKSGCGMPQPQKVAPWVASGLRGRYKNKRGRVE